MDFNIDNYSEEEICKLFNIEYKNLTNELLKEKFFEKKNKLNNSNNPDIQKEIINILNFYTNAYFKLNEYTKNKKLDNIDSINKNLENINNILINNNIQNKNLNKNDIGESPHFVIQQPQQYTVNTYNKNLKPGIVNPIYRETIQKFINIDTRFRDNYHNTESNKFIIELPSGLNKVISMQVVDFNMPKLGDEYVISEILQNDRFRIKMGRLEDANEFVDIIIDYGSYDIDSLIQTINIKLSEQGINNVQIDDFNDKTKKVKFKNVNKDEKFCIDFFFIDRNNCINNFVENNIYSFQLTLGWLLGFRGPYIKKNYDTLTLRLDKQLYQQHTKYENIGEEQIKHQKEYLIKRNPDTKWIDRDGLNIFYENQNSYISESLPNLDFNKEYFLSINDYMNNHNETFVLPFKNNNFNHSNIIAKIVNLDNTNNNNIFPKRVYFGPTNINKIEIKLMDSYGKLFDINYSDYSFTLNFELLYEN